MTKFIKYVFLLSFLILTINNPFAQETNRGFDNAQLQELRQDADYQYEILKPEPENFFQRLWNRLKNWFWSLFESESSRNALDIFLKLLLACAFIYFLVKILGGDIDGIFRSSKKSIELNYEVDEETIHEIDFDAEIAQALKSKNYRLVIRLYYLLALKQAADANWVKLMQGKTNYEYLYDLKGGAIESEFKSLSYLFDYTWYGHFEANKQLVKKAKALVEDISQKKGVGNG